MQRDRGEQRDRRAAHTGTEVAHGRGGDVASRQRGAEQRERAHERGEGHDLGERLAGTVDGDEHRGERPRRDQHDGQRAPGTERDAVAHEGSHDHDHDGDDGQRDRSGGARRPRRTLGSIVTDAGEVQGLDVVEPGGHGHSDRRTTAGRVRAARRAGKAAMRLTARKAPTASRRDGEHRPGAIRRHAELVGDPVPRVRADQQTERHTDHEPDRGDGARLPRDRRPDLTAAETERLQHRELAAPAAQRRHQREADGDERDHRDERGQGHGQPADLIHAVDLRGQRGQDRTGEHRRLLLCTDHRLTIGAGREGEDEVPSTTIRPERGRARAR